jgi:hypothetical protein
VRRWGLDWGQTKGYILLRVTYPAKDATNCTPSAPSAPYYNTMDQPHGHLIRHLDIWYVVAPPHLRNVLCCSTAQGCSGCSLVCSCSGAILSLSGHSIPRKWASSYAAAFSNP